MKNKLLLLSAFVLLSFPFTSHAECNHQWSEWRITKEATCGDYGYKVRTCSLCYEDDYEDIQPTGNHIDTEPSCYTKGTKKRYCDVCNDIQYADIPAYNSHDWSSWSVYEVATCGESGSEDRYCRRC